MLSDRYVDETNGLLVKRAPSKKETLQLWEGLRAGEREAAFYRSIAPHLKDNPCVLKAPVIKRDPWEIHLPYIKDARCIGNGARGEQVRIVCSVAHSLGSVHHDLVRVYAAPEFRSDQEGGSKFGDVFQAEFWEIARDRFSHGAETVREDIWRPNKEEEDKGEKSSGSHWSSDIVSFDDAMKVIRNTHGAPYGVHHGDVWGNNVLIDTLSAEKEEDKRVVFIDWQMFHEGDPLLDLAMLIGLTLCNEEMNVPSVKDIIHAYLKGAEREDTASDHSERKERLQQVIGEDAISIVDTHDDKGVILRRLKRCFYVWVCLSCAFEPVDVYFPEGDDATVMKDRFAAFLNLEV